jgi:hypothetical protein
MNAYDELTGKWYILQDVVRYIYKIREINGVHRVYHIKVGGHIGQSFMDDFETKSNIEEIKVMLGKPYKSLPQDFHLAVQAIFDHELKNVD